MKTFNEWLVEAFDSPVSFYSAGGGRNWEQYKFNINNREFTAEFVSKNDPSDYELIFTDDEGSIEKTGKGDAFSIFSTIYNIIKNFIKSHDPKVIRFSAKSDRESLYDNLSNNLANQIGYELSFSNLGNEKEYILSKIRDSK